MRWLAGLSVLLLALTACQTTSRSGAGVPPVSPQVHDALVEWSNLFNPGRFYISDDGLSYFYDYCPDVRCRNQRPAQRRCAEMTGGRCILLATHGTIPDDLRVRGRDTVRSFRTPGMSTAVPAAPGATGSVRDTAPK